MILFSVINCFTLSLFNMSKTETCIFFLKILIFFAINVSCHFSLTFPLLNKNLK